MPGGSDYQGPPAALERYTAVVVRGGDTVKGAKNPYTSRNGHMFSFLAPDGVLALHLSSELEQEFRAANDSGPIEQYGRTMRGYSTVPADLLADPEACSRWYDRAWDWIGTLEPKPTTKPAKKTSRKATRKKR